MMHVTRTMIENPEADVMKHLEDCARCRRLIATDVDLAGVRSRVLAEVATGSARRHEVVPMVPAWRNTPYRGGVWIVATVAAAAVALFLVPVAWLGLQPGGEVASSGSGPSASEPLVDTGEMPTFEMAFVVGDEVLGRLVWQSSTFYEGLRANITATGVVFGYGMHRANDGWSLTDPGGVTITSDGRDRGTPDLLRDHDIPWGLLIERRSDEAMWHELAGTATEPIAIETTHANATRAWVAEGYLLEVTADGVPVVVERPGRERFEAVSFTRREIRVGEIGNNINLGFEYALFLASTTTVEQRATLEDGIVTFTDYEAAAQAAAQCAEVEATFDDATGSFAFPAAASLEHCVDRFVVDIAAVWQSDTRWYSEDFFKVILHSAPGQAERALASGDLWAISISERFTGWFCMRWSTPRSFSPGDCFAPSGMSIPDVLEMSLTIGSEGHGELTTVSMLGVVTEQADRLVIRFSNGEEHWVTPGHIVEFGYRGFGTLIYGPELSQPVEVEVYADGATLGVFTLPDSSREWLERVGWIVSRMTTPKAPSTGTLGSVAPVGAMWPTERAVADAR